MTTVTRPPENLDAKPGPRPRRLRVNWDVTVVLGLWIILCIVFGAQNGSFWTTANFLAIGSTGAVLALLSLGQTGAILIGGIDLSVGAVAAISGVVFVLLDNHGFGTVGSLLVAVIGVGGVVGLVNALAINVFGINALIATLATMSIVGGIAAALTSDLTISLNNSDAAFLNNNTVGQIPVYLWVVLVLFGLGALLLTRVTTGRSLYVIGGNRRAAILAGLPVISLSIGVYVICSILSGLAGTVATSQLTAANPVIDPTSTLLSVTAVVVGGGALTGGQGGVGGTLAGVLLLSTLSDGLAITGVASFYQQIATGAVLMLAVGVSALRARRRRV